MNEIEFEHPALKVLKMLREEAPNMKLSRAYDFVEEYQSMRYDLGKNEFIIMMLLRALGTNGNGWLSDKEIAEKLKDMPDEIWTALKLAGNIHAGYSCSPFTSRDWDQTALKKFGFEKKDIDSWKESQLSMVLKED